MGYEATFRSYGCDGDVTGLMFVAHASLFAYFLSFSRFSNSLSLAPLHTTPHHARADAAAFATS